MVAGNSAGGFGLLNEFLAHLGDRNYSPRTLRAYAFDLLHFARWLLDEGLSVDEVSTDVLLRYLAVCRSAVPYPPAPRQPAASFPIAARRTDRYSALSNSSRDASGRPAGKRPAAGSRRGNWPATGSQVMPSQELAGF